MVAEELVELTAVEEVVEVVSELVVAELLVVALLEV